jgi:hypothetical protein
LVKKKAPMAAMKNSRMRPGVTGASVPKRDAPRSAGSP